MKRNGFTLVELLISLSIFTLLSGAMYYALGVELNLWKRIVGASEKQQIANFVLTRIVRDTRSASQILPASNHQKLLLKIGPDSIEYTLINQKIRRKKNAYSAYLTDKRDIQILSFSYPASKEVKIKIDKFETRASLRNKNE
jgi:prepilin-type N-terminal cleavage/methylation domain-containing protein